MRLTRELTEDYVGLHCFVGDELATVGIAVDEADSRVLGHQQGSTVAVAYETCIEPIWMGGVNLIEGVTADVACCSGAGRRWGSACRGP